ncbi:hypothetical protein COCON_G00103660 [Conger conger]|uniref:Link domain-containing protein n=1 Tax=Conger conger TaxID=82655 RepID=A0A9Q1DI50_CONCO|nr:hypothetical protein COCON_G00103660 [Conger conger]
MQSADAGIIANLAVVVLPLKLRKVQVYTLPVLGVFEVASMPLPNAYGLNASEAREVCTSLNVTIASKKQVEEAHRNGLETCRYGWTDEQIAVIPRINPSTACGQNRSGVIVWRAPVTKLFDVFCFNSSALEIHLDATAIEVSVTSNQALGLSPPSPTPISERLPQSTFSAPLTSPSLSLSTSPARPEQPVPHEPMSSTESSFGVVPTAVVVTAVTVLLLTAIAALWHNRKSKNSILLWKREQRKEGAGTEVWKSTCEKELNREEEETDRKTSNISVDPEAQAEST